MVNDMDEEKSLLKRIIILIITFLLFILGPSLFIILLNKTVLNLSKMQLVLFGDLFIVIIFILMFKNELILDLKDFKKNYKKYIKFGIKCWLIGLLIMIFSNFIINMVIKSGTEIAGNEEAVRKLILSSPILGIISSAFLAPISEEITFRFAFRKVFNRMIPFALTSTLVFAGLHVLTDFNSLLDLLYLIPYGSLGFAFAIAYFKTNNIFTTIFLHILHNSITFGLIIITYLGAGM